MQVHSGETGVDGGGRRWYNGGDNQQMRRFLTMNEKKQSGYPQEDPREALERLELGNAPEKARSASR